MVRKLKEEWSRMNTCITLLRYQDKTFKVHYGNRNGFPQQMNLKILTTEGTFKYVAGAEDIGFVPVSYVASWDDMKSDNALFVGEWIKYIEMVFASEESAVTDQTIATINSISTVIYQWSEGMIDPDDTSAENVAIEKIADILNGGKQ